MGFSRQEYWSDCHFLLQGICQTQGSNLVLLHCRQIFFFTIWATRKASIVSPGLANCHTGEAQSMRISQIRPLDSWTQGAPGAMESPPVLRQKEALGLALSNSVVWGQSPNPSGCKGSHQAEQWQCGCRPPGWPPEHTETMCASVGPCVHQGGQSFLRPPDGHQHSDLGGLGKSSLSVTHHE